MRSCRFALIVLLLVAEFSWAVEDIVVIVNRDNAVQGLSRSEVIDLYMGRLRHFPDGQPAVALDYPGEDHIRRDFYQLLVGRTLAQVNAYWARLLFNGSAAPPRRLGSTGEVVNVVAADRFAIGYVYENEVTDSVKVVARLKPAP